MHQLKEIAKNQAKIYLHLNRAVDKLKISFSLWPI